MSYDWKVQLNSAQLCSVGKNRLELFPYSSRQRWYTSSTLWSWILFVDMPDMWEMTGNSNPEEMDSEGTVEPNRIWATFKGKRNFFGHPTRGPQK